MTKTKRLVQWFGSNSENAEKVGELLRGCRFVGIPFGGGMSEVPFIDAKQILVNDLHSHIINLCKCVKNNASREWLRQQAGSLPYHPDVLKYAQVSASAFNDLEFFNREAALWYFVAVWMGRGGKAGTSAEFNGALPIRWNAAGGGSNRRYRTAIEALDAWGEAFRRCEFVCMDAHDFIARFQNHDDHGMYVDSNWPDVGDEYRYKLNDIGQQRLANALTDMEETHIVVRFGEDPLIRSLYLESDGWKWLPMESRNQANDVKPEFLICRNLP